jgi:FK506-binding protein 4/5
MDEDFDIPAVDEMNEDFEFAGAEGNPILKVGEEKEIGKQGLKKKLLKEGEGWDTPDVGDEVYGTVSLYLSRCVSLFIDLY